MAELYSVGTVFMQVVPSFDGIQHEARRQADASGKAMAERFSKHLDTVEKDATQRGGKAGAKFSGAFEKSFTKFVADARKSFKGFGDQGSADVRRVVRALDELGKTKFDPQMDTGRLMRDIDLVGRELRKVVNDDSLQAGLRFDAGQAARDLDRIRELGIRNIGLTETEQRRSWQAQYKARHEMENEFARRQAADSAAAAKAEREVRTEETTFFRATAEDRRRTRAEETTYFRAQAEDRRRAAAEAKSQIREQLDLQRLARDDLARSIRSLKATKDVDVRLRGVEKATAQIAALKNVLNSLSGKGVNTTADIIALRRLEDALEDVRQEAVRTNFAMNLRNAGSAANSVRVFNGMLLATATIGPALIPVLAGVAAGIIGIGAAAGGAILGVGVLLAGLSGIGSAVGSMADFERAQRNATATPRSPSSASSGRGLEHAQLSLARAREDAGRRIAAAARNEQRAERDLAEARRDAAEAMNEALDAQIEAQERLTAAQQSARRAQEELNDARERAQRQLEDMNAELAGSADRERRAERAVEEAAARLNGLLEDDQATGREIEGAELNYRDAQRALEEVRRENARLAEDVAEANAKGVEGSDDVVAARGREQEAIRGISDAQQALIEAQQAVRDQAVANTQDIADAEESLSLAREEAARARVEESRTLIDAERAVAEAMQDMAFQATETLGAANTAAQNLREALLSLSPAGQAFATFLFGLKPLLDQIRFAAQDGLLPGLQEGIAKIVDVYGPSFVSFVGSISKVAGDLFVQLADMFTNPFWQEWFSLMAQYAPIFLTQFGSISMSLLTFVAGVLEAFAPFSAEIGQAFVDIAASLATWATSLKDSPAFTEFLEYLRETAPLVGELFVAALFAIVNLMIALAPYADVVLKALIGFLNFVADMDPQVLGILAVGLLLVVAGIQALAGVLSAVLGVAGLFAAVMTAEVGGVLLAVLGWVAVAVVAIAALVVVWALWSDEIIAFAQAAGQAIYEFWNTWVKPVFDAFAWVIQNILGPIFLWFYQAIIKPVVDLIVGVFQVFWAIASTIFNAIYQILTFVVAPAFRWLYDEVIKPWWEKNVQPILTAFGDFFMSSVMPKIETFIAFLGRAWNGILDLLRTPIRLGIEYVFNKGLIAAFNWLAEKVPGMTKLDTIPIPAALQPGGGGGQSGGRPSQIAMASGGVLPGYTPGKDVHRFFSPTAGVLDLSGGEGIARPEIVRAIGKRRWDAANAAARGGNVGAALGFLGGYADGGILGALGDTWDSVTGGIGGFFSDVGSALTNPARWLGDLLAKAASSLGFDGFLRDATIGVATSGVGALVDWIKSQFGAGEADATPSGTGIGYQAMSTLALALNPGARVTSSFRPGAVTAGYGATSFHALGRAIDLVGPNLMSIFNAINGAYGSKSQELLYTPAGGRQILRGGQRGVPNAITQANHHDHVHWAMASGGVVPTLYDNGGVLPPGLSLVANQTRKPEAVFTDSQLSAMQGGRGPAMEVSFAGAQIGYDPREVASALETKRRDTLALAGLLDEEVMF